MSHAQRRGGALARAVDELALVDAHGHSIPLRARVVDEGLGGPRVEVRRADVVVRGHALLVGVIALEPAPRLRYVVPVYRAPLEAVLRAPQPRR